MNTILGYIRDKSKYILSIIFKLINKDKTEGTDSGKNKEKPEKKISESERISNAIDDVATAIREETAAQNQEETRANIISEGQRQQQITANKIARTSNLVNTFLFGATLVVLFLNKCAVDAATRSATAAENTFKEEKKRFNVANRAQLGVPRVVILRNSWKGRSDTIVLAYYVVNITEHPIQIDSVKHKWVLDSASLDRYTPRDWDSTAKYDVDFSKIEGLKSVNQSAITQGWYFKGSDSAEFFIVSHTNNKDSTNLDKNRDLLFTEIYYTNVYTDEKFKGMLIARLYGDRDKWRGIYKIYYSKAIPNY